jgi:hypothetical protein
LEESVLNYNIILTKDNGDEGVSISNHRFVDRGAVDEETDIVFHRADDYLMSSTSEDDFYLQEY